MLGLFQHHWCGRVRAEDLPDLGEGNLGASLGSGKMQPALLWAFFFFPVELYRPFSGQEAVCTVSFASLNAILSIDH